MDRLSDHAPPPPALIEALEESEADFAAGRVISGEVMRARLRETVAEMEADQSALQVPSIIEAAPRR